MTQSQTAALLPVQWIATRAALPDDCAPLLEQAGDPGQLVDALLAQGRGPEAVRCVASALPAREGVWWAWVSARHSAQLVHGAALPPLLKLCLDGIEKWVNAPSDDLRRAAWSAGDALGSGTPAGAAAAGVFMSGGSIGTPGTPDVPPPPGLTGTMISTSVVLAVATAPPEAMPSLWPAVLQHGRAIVEQLGGWDAAIAATWRALEMQQQEHARANPPAAGA